DAGLGAQRLVERADHLAVPARRVGDVLAEGAAVDRQCVQVQVLRDLAQHRRQAAGVVEVLHQVLARRLEVDQAGQARADLVPVLDRKSTRLNSSHVKISYA